MYKIIVARTLNNGIGNNNTIPWTNSEDLNHFKSKTYDNIVIMGRKTWESLSNKIKPLPNRINIIISKSMEIKNDTRLVFKSIDQCHSYLTGNELYKNLDWYVIGGENIYNQYMDRGLISDVYISQLAINTSCDKYFNYFKNNTPNDSYKLNKVKYMNTFTIFHFCKYPKNEEETKLLDTMRELIEEGYYQENRTGINAYCLFAKSFNYKMIENEIDGVMTYRIPLLTTKKVFVKGIFEELMWFLSGSTDSTELEKKRVNIWKGNTRREYLDSIGLNNYKEGQTGPLYGFQFRHWGAEFNPEKNDYTGEGINQISNAINLLKTDPFSRRIIISTWNTSDLDKMCLNPCHVLYQFYVIEKNNKKYLNLILTQRSADVFLGLPYNIVSASLLLLIIAKEVDMIPYNMTHNIGNMHIYESHINAVKTQIKRDPFKFPYISIISKKKDLKYEFKDIKIHNYNHHSKITADMAV